MTIAEDAASNITWLRLPEWNASAMMKIDIVGNGHGPIDHPRV